MVVQDIQEVSQYLKLKFKISLQWMDARVLFYNIKIDENMNHVSQFQEEEKTGTQNVFREEKSYNVCFFLRFKLIQEFDE